MDASFNESIENYKKFKEDKSPNTIAFAINKAEIAYRYTFEKTIKNFIDGSFILEV